MQYGYFVGVVMLGIVWFYLYHSRNDLRKEIIFGSFLGLPFGITEFLYIPEYWNPPSAFNLIEKIGFGLESVLFGFFVAGIAAVLFEFVRSNSLVKIPADHGKHYFPYILLVFSYLFLEVIFPDKSIYNLIFSLSLTSIIIMLRRKDLTKQILLSGAFFATVYFGLFLMFNTLFPGYIETVYNLENFIGILIVGVPIEEILFAFSVGACWSTFYEFINGYRTHRLKKGV